MKQLSLTWSRATSPGQPAAWPFVPSASFFQALRRLLSATEGLPLAGWESSCRLSPGRTTTNRLLFGLDTAAVAPQRLRALPQELGMPQDLAQGFLQELPHARRVLLAAEQGVHGVELKAYHEFHGSLDDAADLPPGLAMRGRKWRDAGPAGAVRCTDYLRPGLDTAALRRWLSTRSGLPDSAAPALDLLARAVDKACAIGSTPPDFLSVTELASARLSCCVRFYDSGLHLQALRPALARLALAWALPHALLERLPGQRRLGWLAAGVDATHLPFLTLYSESSLADARLAIALGAFDEHP